MESSTTLRPELKDLPARMKRLPIDPRGYPIPEFVDTIDGQRDFRFMNQEHWINCVKHRKCWVCGDQLGSYMAFVIGPMCAISRTTSEPPCHLDCAEWSAKFCPFLSRPHMHRREDELTDVAQENVAGCPILRNPGVACVWVTHKFKVFYDDRGKPLIEVGDADNVLWFAEGRAATRAEVAESIRTGLPLLEEMAVEPGAKEELHRGLLAVEAWLPRRK